MGALVPREDSLRSALRPSLAPPLLLSARLFWARGWSQQQPLPLPEPLGTPGWKEGAQGWKPEASFESRLTYGCFSLCVPAPARSESLPASPHLLGGVSKVRGWQSPEEPFLSPELGLNSVLAFCQDVDREVISAKLQTCLQGWRQRPASKGTPRGLRWRLLES